MLTGLLTAVAGPAWADPAGPTHFRSTITDIVSPDAEVLPELEILGGDAFLVVRAPLGSVVEVPGYAGEPYVRIEADGTVEVNERSPARYLNDARYGEADVEVPPIADPDAPPTWTVVADGGEYAWHDHRIHFMSPALPPQVDTSAGTVQPVLEWSVPLVIDGSDVEVVGELEWVPGPSMATPLLLTVVAAGAALALAVVASRWIVPALLGGAVVAFGVGVTQHAGMPAGADGEFALLVLPGVVLILVAGGTLLERAGHRLARLIAPAAGVPLVVWAVLLIGTLTRPIVPGTLSVGVVRVAVAAILAVGVAALIVFARTLLEATSLDAQLGGGDASRADPLPSG